MIQRILFLLVLIQSAALAQHAVLGTVLEEGNDNPVSYVNITYSSGKEIGQTDSRGRFEIEVRKANSVLQFSKSGYETVKVDLSDYGDHFDVVVMLVPNVSDLGSQTVQESSKPTLNVKRGVPIDVLEDAAGMRFDITEHLVQLPGISGMKDFSSDVSYNGSRSEDVSHFLGKVRVPNMRHLDVSFPGNLSVINPHVLKEVQLHDDLSTGPVDQGLAAAVQYQPYDGNKDFFQVRGAAGLVNRELFITGPWLFWDSFVFSGRYMDASMLKNLGQKFFTEYDRDREGEGVASRKDAYDLSAFDLYAHMARNGKDGSRSSLTSLISSDDYKVRQDTSSRLDTVNATTISEGSQWYGMALYTTSDSLDNTFQLGWVSEVVSDTIRDTSAFREESNGTFNNFLGGDRKEVTTYTLGIDRLLPLEILNGEWSLGAEYENISTGRYYPERNQMNLADHNAHVYTALMRSVWQNSKGRSGLALGVKGDIDGALGPIASLDYETPVAFIEKGRLYGSGAFRQDYVVHPEYSGENSSLRGDVKSAATLKLGLGAEQSGMLFNLQGYGSYYLEPEVPEASTFWQYRQLSQADDAWVGGLSFSLNLHTLHHWAWQMNLSSVYGEYNLEDGKTLQWAASRDYDLVSSVRWYPRSDSLISMTLTYRASAGQPLYKHYLQLSGRDEEGGWYNGTREVANYRESADQYRTDLRVNLDLTSQWKNLGLDDLRFYLEVNNIFAGFDFPGSEYLGGDNMRQRSWLSYDPDENAENGITLVPWMARGMGLFVQFGVEGNFSF
jgi:hypothetical protein